MPLDHASIPETLVTEYERDGAVILRGVVPMHWIERLRAGVDENMRVPGPYGKRYTPDGKPGMFFGDYCNWRRIDAYRDFLKDALAPRQPLPRARAGEGAGHRRADALAS